MFHVCEKCGKKLIERQPNGLWRFKFGSSKSGEPVVNMTIHGSLTLKCLRRSCGHVNTFNYFPDKEVAS